MCKQTPTVVRCRTSGTDMFVFRVRGAPLAGGGMTGFAGSLRRWRAKKQGESTKVGVPPVFVLCGVV